MKQSYLKNTVAKTRAYKEPLGKKKLSAMIFSLGATGGHRINARQKVLLTGEHCSFSHFLLSGRFFYN